MLHFSPLRMRIRHKHDKLDPRSPSVGDRSAESAICSGWARHEQTARAVLTALLCTFATSIDAIDLEPVLFAPGGGFQRRFPRVSKPRVKAPVRLAFADGAFMGSNLTLGFDASHDPTVPGLQQPDEGRWPRFRVPVVPTDIDFLSGGGRLPVLAGCDCSSRHASPSRPVKIKGPPFSDPPGD
jgi:hypothetical protein